MAEVNARIVGGLGFNGGERIRIQHTGEFGVTVSKDYWGVGIGSKLIGAPIDWAKNTGLIRKINLRVHQDNVRAIRLYNSGLSKRGRLAESIITTANFTTTCLWG